MITMEKKLYAQSHGFIIWDDEYYKFTCQCDITNALTRCLHKT
jgi:hypothetical protein